MRTKIKTEDKLFILRQYFHLRKKNISHTECIEKLLHAADSKQQNLIKDLSHHLSDGQNNNLAFRGYFKELPVRVQSKLDSKLLTGETLSSDVGKILTLEEENKYRLQELFSSFKSNLNYVSSLLIIFLLISILLATKVFPSFVGLFEGVSANLPAFTKAILTILNVHNPLFYILMFIMLILIYINFKLSRRKNLNLKKIKFVKYLPFVSSIYKDLHKIEHFEYLSAFSEHIGNSTNILNDPLFLSEDQINWKILYPKKEQSKLTLSIQANTFEQEKKILGQEITQETTEKILNQLNNLASSFYTLAVILIGTLIISMYLPIFKMGSVI